MKRKSCLIEFYEGDIESVGKRTRAISLNETSEKLLKMHCNTQWYKSLLAAEKTCIKSDKIKKIHYKFENESEMVEEYNIDTKVLLRRAWKVRGNLGGDGKWDVEVGDPIPDATPHIDSLELYESKDQPIILKRNTRINIEWRIRNLPYPISTYDISVNNEERVIVVRTNNKKYFKKLEIPELQRLNLPLDDKNLTFTHQFNTLIITYKKPQALLEMERDWYEELLKVKQPMKDVPSECKPQ